MLLRLEIDINVARDQIKIFFLNPPALYAWNIGKRARLSARKCVLFAKVSEKRHFYGIYSRPWDYVVHAMRHSMLLTKCLKIIYNRSLVPADFSGAVFTRAHFKKWQNDRNWHKCCSWPDQDILPKPSCSVCMKHWQKGALKRAQMCPFCKSQWETTFLRNLFPSMRLRRTCYETQYAADKMAKDYISPRNWFLLLLIAVLTNSVKMSFLTDFCKKDTFARA